MPLVISSFHMILIKAWFFFMLLIISVNFKSQSQNILTLTNVNIVDVKNGLVLKKQVIEIKDGYIKRISQNKDDLNGNRVVDLQGKFVSPGLVDMHAHIPGNKSQPHNLDRYLKLNFVHGITSLRCMRGNEMQLHLRESLKDNSTIAPRLYVSAPPIRKNNFKGITSLSEYKNQGYDFIKILSIKDTITYKRILKISDSLNIKVVGHVPFNELLFALDNGQASIEHIESLSNYKSTEGLKDKIKGLEERSAYLCPTAYWYVINGYTVDIDSLRFLNGNEFVNPKLYGQWVSVWKEKISQATQYQNKKANYFELLEKFKNFLKLAGAENNIKFLISPGDGFFTIPGVSYFSEMEYLNKNGLTNIKVIQAATCNAGEVLDSRIGVIEEGAFADLIITNHNPLENMSTLKNINGIVLDGFYYDEEFILKTKRELVQ